MRRWCLLVLIAACKNRADELCDDDQDGFVEDVCAAQATLPGGDCDDDDANVNPDAAETCNGADDNCNGINDDDEAVDRPTWYRDADADGAGTPTDVQLTCDAPAGYVASDDDCDDDDSNVQMRIWYADADKDGFGDAALNESGCDQVAGHVASNEDCDDANNRINPDADEVCGNGLDDDCDGTPIGCGFNGQIAASDEGETFGGTATGDYDIPIGAADVDGDGEADLLIGSRNGPGGVFLGPSLSGRTTPDAALAAPYATNFADAAPLQNIDGLPGSEVVVAGGGVFVVGWDGVAGDLSRRVGGISGMLFRGRAPHFGEPSRGLVGGLAAGGNVRVAGNVDLPSVEISESEADFQIADEHTSDNLMLAALDFDGDGVDTLVIALPAEAPNPSGIYFWDTPPNGTLTLAEADAATTDAEGMFGIGLAVLDDVDGDGRPSLAFASDKTTGSEPGTVYVVEGSDRTPAAATSTISSGADDGGFGTSLAFIPASSELDVPRLLVAAPTSRNDLGGRVRAFELPLVAGAIDGNDATAVIEGPASSQTGVRVAAASDQNDDGYADVAVGASATPFGMTFLLYGGGL